MIYLDNAATTFPKPLAVPKEVYRCMTEYCGNPGRSGHSLSLAAANKVFECRCELAELFGISNPARIVFTQNTTHALNLVIKGILRQGDHVIISDLEHNSVLRPITHLADKGVIEYSVFSTRPLERRRSPSLICAEIAHLIRKNTRLVVATHSSNICSLSLPISEIGALCRARGVMLVTDAAQAAGVMPIDIEKMNITALCAPAHKALYGPQGCGFAALSENCTLETLLEGGSGTASLDSSMPDEPPERYEAGTLATPAIAGLCEGVRFVRRLGVDAIREYEKELYLHARELLMNIDGIKIYLPEYIGSTMLINKDGIGSEELSRRLDKHGICTRGGYHCSPLAHSTLGTLEGGGVRISLGIFNSKRDIEELALALCHI